MAPVGTPNRGDICGMAGRCEPVMDRRPDLSPLHWRFARAMVAGDQEKHAFTACDREVEAAVDRHPSSIEIHAMQIEDPVRVDRAREKLLVPAAVEGFLGMTLLPGTGRGTVARSAMVEGPLCWLAGPLHRLRRFPSPFRGGF